MINKKQLLTFMDQRLKELETEKEIALQFSNERALYLEGKAYGYMELRRLIEKKLFDTCEEKNNAPL